MAKTRTRQPSRRQQKGKPPPSRSRKPAAPWQRTRGWLPWAVGFAVLVGVVLAARSGGDDAQAPGAGGTNPVVGSDLHSLVVDPDDPDTVYIGSHGGVSVSRDGGGSWEPIETLDGADAMGWAFSDDATLVGGHPGLYVSTDGGETFEQRNEGLPNSDVHALGASRGTIYAASPAVGVFASTDGGASWEVRTDQAGQAFMGRILVAPQDDDHLVAPDMQGGAVTSRDGGRTWEALGGVQGAMWVSWDEQDTDHLIVAGQAGAAESTDGGRTWDPLDVPDGAWIVELSPHDPDVLFAAVLQAPEAVVHVSRDGGTSWARP
jgi:photosystem II stability/assembly factor-like uncharacterized protein